ncbi:hypothetical protein Pmar_PMAR009557 [Perkinsus marinus ATCC 50983]|uniref:Uncharacterized protein n=1 Tax=Perkinsus marinus (strain ATCC 50983 / TXsc) TaxID=423536 RepID=C5KEI4_PERM5|nr:hypothetical protein Pmar_PMAR009557 [Perkinsus marinus ATCC 50983]EER17122.1 hypothetical protein Pmar_PMAR009557 [Perkinsus marinus ATCC 50983]|eukprot:XP_002785326.1 hypothetical protein Pmar_PMAR009557 [Perkinsus marinus ATCC 50983]
MPRNNLGRSRRSPSRRGGGNKVVQQHYHQEVTVATGQQKATGPAPKANRYAPPAPTGGTAGIHEVYDPEHIIVGASHSKTAQILVDKDPVLHEIVVDAIRYAAEQFRRPHGADKNARLVFPEGQEDEGLAGYLEFSKLVNHYLHNLAVKSDPFHKALLATSTVVVGNMGFCGNIPCFRYKLKLIMPEHYASPYTLRTKNVPYSWCNVFFLEPQEDTYAGLN